MAMHCDIDGRGKIDIDSITSGIIDLLIAAAKRGHVTKICHPNSVR